MDRCCLVVIGLCVAMTMGGCSISPEGNAHAVRRPAVPFRLLDPDAPPLLPIPSGETELVRLCFIREGRLLIVARALPSPVAPAHLVVALAQAPPPLRTAVGEPSIVDDLRVGAGIAHVDLDPRVSTLSSDEQLLAVAQIVCTLTTRPGIGQVAFTLDDAPVDVPRADGALVSSPVSRDDYTPLIDPPSTSVTKPPG